MGHRSVFYYDSRSNLTCVRDPDLGLTYYTYDAGNRMSSAQNPFGEVTYYDYTPGGRMTKRVLGNDSASYYEYDTIGRTTKVDNRKSDLTVVSSFEYERDAVGNPVSILREDDSVVYYEYDAKHQLTRETQRDDQGQDMYAYEWDYDAAGNREYQVFNGTATYYEYNAANELLTETTGADTIYYHYDGCGNTTAKQEALGTTYYQWDHENLMTRIDFPDASHNYFAYDADSKRVEKRDSEGYTRFVYQGPDMLRLLLECDGDGDTQVHYTVGAGLEAMRRADGGDISAGDSSFYHYNHLGTTVALTDAEESLTDTYRHDAWGVQLANTGSTVNPHTYVGQQRYYRMPEAVLYHAGFRNYGPAVGRFVSVDPQRDGLNWYAYANQCAPAAIDPEGLAAWRDDRFAWTATDIERYHWAAIDWLKNAYRTPDRWQTVDCADLAMTMLVDIASRMGKRVCLFNPQREPHRTREFNSTDRVYVNSRQYLEAVKRKIGAKHLRATNTLPVAWRMSARAGDLFVSSSHTRVILSIYPGSETGELMAKYYATDPGGPLKFETTTYHLANIGGGPRRWAFDNFFDPVCCDKSHGM